MAAVSPLLRCSTDDLPARDRIPIWCEEIGRTYLKVDFQPVAGRRFRQAAEVYALNELAILFFQSDGVNAHRATAHLADSIEYLNLHIALSGVGLASQMRHELKVDAGEAILLDAGEPCDMIFPGSAHALNLRIRRRTLAGLVHDPEGTVMRRVPASTPALRLLVDYVHLTMQQHDLKEARLQQLFSTHVHDLVALTLGATRDGTALAQARGLPAARLQAIKADIARRFADEGLSVSDVARRHGVTPRYVHMLFEPEDQTFSEFLIEQRLTQAHRMLTGPRHAARTISAIAFEVGFGNLSNFNRLFRRRYGASPSDIRAAARSARNSE